jgi:hypothetical protein
MTITRGAQRAILGAYFCVLAILYVLAWTRPAIGLAQEDALHLVTAKALAAGHGYVIDSLPRVMAETRYPPLFPALLALATLISTSALWLKLLPLLCAAGWLWVTQKLLLKMGASWLASRLIVAVAAACPMVIFLSTNLFPQALFGLLAMGCLLALLDERALLAGILAGLATITQISGVALIGACILTFVARRRFRSAVIFALVAMVIAAPWFGYSLALNNQHDPLTIFTGLPASDKAIVISHNVFDLLATPLAVLTGRINTLTVSVTVIALTWCLILRRQTVPDVFVAFYGIALLVMVEPPAHYVVPVLPLLFWVVWRAARRIETREPIAALLIFTMAIPVGIGATAFYKSWESGFFAAEGPAPDRWSELQKIYRYLRMSTPAESVVLANMDSLTFLSTGRKALRGFDTNRFEVYYSPRHSPAGPDQLSRAIVELNVGYVVLAPDEGLPESGSFHRSVEALERGGVVEAVSVAGLAAGYQLFRVLRQ